MFMELDDNGEQKCRGKEAAQKYKDEHVSKDSLITLPGIEGEERCQPLLVHPEVCHKLFSTSPG